MNSIWKYKKSIIALTVLCWLAISAFGGYPQWYKYYIAGTKSMESGDWEKAATNFRQAIEIKDKEKKKTKIGTMSVEYLPHRELGICLYKLSDMTGARKQLQISMTQAPTPIAKAYLKKVYTEKPPDPIIRRDSTDTTITEIETSSSSLIGNRLSIAILPFENKNISGELASIDLLDKLITWFKETNRFDVVERSQLEKILEEQKLSLTGVISSATAVKVGKTMGVDAVVIGSWTRHARAVSVDARLVDTETAKVITAKEAMCERMTLPRISKMISDLVRGIVNDFPIVDGYVIRADGNAMTIDIGHEKGIRKGTRCYIYREGEPLIHPITGEKIPEFEIIGEALVTDVFDKSSKAVMIKTEKVGLSPKIMDKVQTK